MEMMEEYFHKMGGSGRYPLFEPMDIPITVIVIITVRFFPNLESKIVRFVPEDMFNESYGFITDIKKSLDSIKHLQNIATIETIMDFMNWIEKQKEFHSSYRWIELKQCIATANIFT